MPVLPNPKHESFAQERARGKGANEYHHLYKDQRWCGKHGIRLAALRRDNFTCQRCGCYLVIGKPKHPRSATVNHKTPHKGDTALFFDLGNTESVCKSCHDGRIQREEERGYLIGCDESGRPVDDGHPWNGE